MENYILVQFWTHEQWWIAFLTVSWAVLHWSLPQSYHNANTTSYSKSWVFLMCFRVRSHFILNDWIGHKLHDFKCTVCFTQSPTGLFSYSDHRSWNLTVTSWILFAAVGNTFCRAVSWLDDVLSTLVLTLLISSCRAPLLLWRCIFQLNTSLLTVLPIVGSTV